MNKLTNFEGIARQGRSSLQCYIERKHYKPKDGIEPENGHIIKAKITIPDFGLSMERTLYKIKRWFDIPIMEQHIGSSVGVTVTLFTVKNEEKLGISKVKTEYDIKTTIVYGVEDIEDLIKELISKYTRGRVLKGYKKRTKVWGLAPGVSGRSIYYKQATGILKFENKSMTRVPEIARPAIQHSDPKLIPGEIDFGNYILESWRPTGSTRRNYSYIAFDKGTENWVEKVCRQVTL